MKLTEGMNIFMKWKATNSNKNLFLNIWISWKCTHYKLTSSFIEYFKDLYWVLTQFANCTFTMQKIETDSSQNWPELELLEGNMPKRDILWLEVDNQLQVTAYFPLPFAWFSHDKLDGHSHLLLFANIPKIWEINIKIIRAGEYLPQLDFSSDFWFLYPF